MLDFAETIDDGVAVTSAAGRCATHLHVAPDKYLRQHLITILSFTYINIGVVIWVKRAPGEAEHTRDRRLAASKRKVRSHPSACRI